MAVLEDVTERNASRRELERCGHRREHIVEEVASLQIATGQRVVTADNAVLDAFAVVFLLNGKSLVLERKFLDGLLNLELV